MAKQFLSAISCYPGAVGSPGLYLGSDTSTGFYRIGANNIGVAISGSKVLDVASTGLSVTGQVTSTSLYISGNLTLSQGTGSTSNNLKLKGQGAGAQGISFYDYTDVWQGQLYMAASSYGFLNSNWGGWDLSKAVNGQLSITVSSVSQTVLHTGNYNSYSPTLTGTGASGTWGISISGNAATSSDSTLLSGIGLAGAGVAPGINKVVRSDGYGYTFLNYINSNTANNENPTISQVITQNGSDNYYRKSSIVHLTSSLSGTAPIAISGNSATATTLQTARTINGTSFNGSANISTTEWYHSGRDFPNGTLISTNIDYSVTSGDPWVLEIRGNSYGSLIPFDIQVQGYIYSDTIISYGGYSNGTGLTSFSVFNNGGYLCFWFNNAVYWQGFNVRAYAAHATYALNRITGITNVAKPGGITKEVSISLVQSLHSSNYTSYAATAGHNHSGVYEPANANIQSHIGSTSNPHSVTATQVGLGNVTNESKATMFTNATFTGTFTLAGGIKRSATTGGYLDGQYPSVETASGTAGAIYTIGGSYQPAATTLGNMYGIGYGYSGTAGITATGAHSSKWGMYVASGGTSRIFLNSDDGHIYINGRYYGDGSQLTNLPAGSPSSDIFAFAAAYG